MIKRCGGIAGKAEFSPALNLAAAGTGVNVAERSSFSPAAPQESFVVECQDAAHLPTLQRLPTLNVGRLR